jgi:hypothetical protein
MTLAKVVRKGSYQGVSQWGINTSSEITPSRKTAQKWAELENARNPMTHSEAVTIVRAKYPKEVVRKVWNPKAGRKQPHRVYCV